MRAKEATLLYKDCQVCQWVKWRDQRGFLKLKEYGAYIEVTMEEMENFYSFKNANFTPGKVELPNKELLQYYVESKGLCFPVVEKYGEKHVSMSVQDVDEFCEWINQSRRKGNFSSH